MTNYRDLHMTNGRHPATLPTATLPAPDRRRASRAIIGDVNWFRH
jgi:hypothetical protein